PTIVHPGRLAPDRSAAVCGQCHAYAFPRDENAWWSEGYSRAFEAGDSLDRSRVLITRERMTAPNGGPIIEALPDSIFWSGGGVRVGGREYNGLLASPCYERGEGERKMTCLSCHSMHEGDPGGQIRPSLTTDELCTSCHTGERARNHSHHAEGSPGA